MDDDREALRQARANALRWVIKCRVSKQCRVGVVEAVDSA